MADRSLAPQRRSQVQVFSIPQLSTENTVSVCRDHIGADPRDQSISKSTEDDQKCLVRGLHAHLQIDATQHRVRYWVDGVISEPSASIPGGRRQAGKPNAQRLSYLATWAF